MKTRTLLLLALLLMASLGLASLAPAIDAPKNEPRFKAVVTCFNGQADSGSFCSGPQYQEDGVLSKSGWMRCGWVGKVSEVEWKFVRRQGGKDVYEFKRRFPIETAGVESTSKEVKFEGKRVKIFEDKFQCIVIEGPREGEEKVDRRK